MLGPDSGCVRTPQRSCRLLILYKSAECDKTVIAQCCRRFFQHQPTLLNWKTGGVLSYRQGDAKLVNRWVHLSSGD